MLLLSKRGQFTSLLARITETQCLGWAGRGWGGIAVKHCDISNLSNELVVKSMPQ